MEGLEDAPTDDLMNTLIGLVAGALHGQGKPLPEAVKAAGALVTEFGDRMHAEGAKREGWS